MKIAVKPAKLIKRYKRFLADIVLSNGEVTTIHCANTGAMTGCAQPGDTVWYSTSDNPKRKYPHSWEFTQTQNNDLICVNTIRANQLVEEALQAGKISELIQYTKLKREVKYGQENSKIDFLLTQESLHEQPKQAFVEVKSATLLSQEHALATQGQGFFPDAVTVRGQKHLRELMTINQQKQEQAVLLFAVLHSGINAVSPAAHIDHKYAELLTLAQEEGVTILAYKAEFTLTDQTIDISLKTKIPVTF